jgi:hypothetical protein
MQRLGDLTWLVPIIEDSLKQCKTLRYSMAVIYIYILKEKLLMIQWSFNNLITHSNFRVLYFYLFFLVKLHYYNKNKWSHNQPYIGLTDLKLNSEQGSSYELKWLIRVDPFFFKKKNQNYIVLINFFIKKNQWILARFYSRSNSRIWSGQVELLIYLFFLKLEPV